MKNILNFNKTNLFLLLAIVLISTASCRKEGLGGKSSITGSVKHHSKLIPNCIVYIKYGAKEFPGTNVGLYDSYTNADGNAHYEFKDLRKGDYYLYAVGYDVTISETVSGGIGVKLKYNRESTIDVPVTE